MARPARNLNKPILNSEGEMKRIGPMITALGLFLCAQLAQADWTTAVRLTWTSGDSYGPTMAIDSNGNMHIVWDDYTNGDPEVYYMRSANKGTTWYSAKRITCASGYCYSPDIAIDKSRGVPLDFARSQGIYLTTDQRRRRSPNSVGVFCLYSVLTMTQFKKGGRHE